MRRADERAISLAPHMGRGDRSSNARDSNTHTNDRRGRRLTTRDAGWQANSAKAHPMQNVLVLDNYDSFTWNLVHALGPLGVAVEVHRNDAISVDEIAQQKPDAIVISPGPCTPDEAGISLDLIRRLGGSTPILGVCLGHQAVGQAYGGKVVRAPAPVHGKLSRIRHRGEGVLRGINGPFEATRYHSLVVARDSMPADLSVTAETDDGIVMALSHKRHPVHSVQFHPESIASEHGRTILKNFLDLAAAWNAARRT
jgi:anthranilate synthase component 2